MSHQLFLQIEWPQVEVLPYSFHLQDMLLKMPGLSSKNVFTLMNKVEDLDHLISLNPEELAETLDSENNAQLLHKFLHRRYQSDASGASHNANGTLASKAGAKRTLYKKSAGDPSGKEMATKKKR